MKKTITSMLKTMALPLLCVAMTAQMFIACSQSPDKLSAGTVKDLVEELLENSGQEQSFVEIPVGTFELNSQHDRGVLMKLKAAGVINYQVKRYAWWNKTLEIRNYYSWNSVVGPVRERIGNTYYDFEEHFVVTVSLTEGARQYQVDSIPQPKTAVDEDMRQPDIDPGSFPENKISLTEEWPYIPNPDAPRHEDQPTKTTYDLSQQVMEDDDPGCETDEDYDAPVRLSLDIETSTNYEDVARTFHQETVILKSAKLVVEDARFIQVYDHPQTGARCGSAEIIVEMREATPAGRVLEQKHDGIRFCSPVSLVYYADKGWILQDRQLHLQGKSSLGIAVTENGTITGGDATDAIERSNTNH